MKFVSPFHIADRKNISDWKNAAFLAGQKNILWSVFVSKTRFYNEDFQTGLVAEVIVAWMLGLFQENAGINFDVSMSEYADKKKKIDFAITRQGMTSQVQMKFENRKEFRLPCDVIRVDVAAAKGFSGMKAWKHHDSGVLVLDKILVKTGLFDEFEIADFCDEHPDFCKVINMAWKWMKN